MVKLILIGPKEDGADLRELQRSLLDHLQQNLRENVLKTQIPDPVFHIYWLNILRGGIRESGFVCFFGQSRVIVTVTT